MLPTIASVCSPQSQISLRKKCTEGPRYRHRALRYSL